MNTYVFTAIQQTGMIQTYIWFFDIYDSYVTYTWHGGGAEPILEDGEKLKACYPGSRKFLALFWGI